MLSQISTGDNVCDFGQSSYVMDPNCTTGNLSVSLQSPHPFEIRSADVSQRMVALDVSGTEVLQNAFDSISITELSQKEDDKGKDTVKTDNASESECPDNACIAPRRRSGRNSKLSQNLATVSARNGRRIAIKKTSIDLSSLQITRKRRSYFSKQARSSVWGLLENTVQSFERNVRLEIASGKQKNFRIAKKGGSANEKHGKNQIGRKSRKSKGKRSIPTGPISLKVKFGPRCLKDVIPLIDNDTNKSCTAEEELKKMPASKVDDRFGEEVVNVQFHGCSGSLDNEYVSLSEGCQLGKSAVQDPAAKALVCHVDSPSQDGRSINNRFSDPGTSPDSEVINLIPDTPIDVPEEFHDLTLSKPCATPVDAPILRMHEKSCKKGRKKDRLPKVSNSGVKDLLSPESTSNAQVFGNLMQGEKQRDGLSCSDTSVLTTAGNGTGNTFSTVIFSGELLHCSGVSSLRISCAFSNPESDPEGNHCSSVGTESPVSGFSEKLVSSPDERKVSKEGTPKESGKRRPEVPSLSKGRGSNKKGNKEKEDTMHEVKHKSDPVKCLGEVRQHSGTENGIPSGLGQVVAEKKSLDGDISNLDILQSEIGERLLPPRSAWVQCDDCLKWRRIPSLLADQIEETNCRWTCKDNLDRAFANCSFPQEKSNSEINAELEISDGSGEEDVSRTDLSSNGSGQKNLPVAHQSSWNRIKSNLFLHRNRKNQPIDEIMVCQCKPPSDGRMGCGDGCLNRILNIECAKGTCPCGEFCSNQQFQKRNYAKLKCFKCGKKGYGLQLLENVFEGQFLIEYVGEVLDMHVYEARQKEYALKCHKHFYFMTLNGSEVIDACAKGNLGRFINHSCDPNCRTEKWIVNGEVCIGLFALRDIKKGEEVTFDYNYVRIFGAAVKKCVCGSANCRGYIGGDPLNAEVIVQEDSDDEYPEPVVLREDAKMDNKEDNITCATSTINCAKIIVQRKQPKKKNTLDGFIAENQETSCQTDINSSVGQEKVNLGNSISVDSLNFRKESENFPGVSPASPLKAETCAALKASECLSHSSAQPAETSLSLKDTCETVSGVRKRCTVAGKVVKYSISSAQELEITSPDAGVSKSLRKSKSSNGKEIHDSLKSSLIVKTSRESSLVKKGKQRNYAVNSRSSPDVDSKLQVPQPKLKKPLDGSLHGHFEAVEEKLNELLDHDGGISKRKDASRCYLKLLLLTAASGDGCNGEAIQSNRDLSMILDAILKTKSRTVLMDIINKNGLQMLHNIMKRYRREFNKIPILRKLLKVLEYLAVRDILSPEHINGDTSRAGVQSLRSSIFGLTEHEDKQVHQIARNFRDRWIVRPLRKRSCIDRDDWRINTQSGYNRCLASQNLWCDLGCKPLEGAEYTCHSAVASVQADAGVLDGSSASCSDIGAAFRAKKRKHKSRCDQEAEAKSDPRNDSDVAEDEKQVLDDDVPPGYEFPPGFSVPVKTCRVLSDDSTAIYSTEECNYGEHPQPVVMGHLQQRFVSRLPVSYGIPFSLVQQFGSPQKGSFDGWTVALGIPFHPFPPLPPYPCDKRDFVPTAANLGVTSELPQNDGEDWGTCSPGHLAQNPPSVSGADHPQDGNGNQLGSERASDSHNLGRKNFRKQKFNNSKLIPPWVRLRSGWEYTGNSLKNSMCIAGIASRENEFRSTHSWVEHNFGMQNLGHALRPNTFHRY